MAHSKSSHVAQLMGEANQITANIQTELMNNHGNIHLLIFTWKFLQGYWKWLVIFTAYKRRRARTLPQHTNMLHPITGDLMAGRRVCAGIRLL